MGRTGAAARGRHGCFDPGNAREGLCATDFLCGRIGQTFRTVITGSATTILPVDSDVDGISDASDNCTLAANPTQLDSSNGDGGGNACDADLDNNGRSVIPPFLIAAASRG